MFSTTSSIADSEEKEDKDLECEFSEPFSPPQKSTPRAKRIKFDRVSEESDKFNEGLMTIMKESNEILKEHSKQRL